MYNKSFYLQDATERLLFVRREHHTTKEDNMHSIYDHMN